MPTIQYTIQCHTRQIRLIYYAANTTRRLHHTYHIDNSLYLQFGGDTLQLNSEILSIANYKNWNFIMSDWEEDDRSYAFNKEQYLIQLDLELKQGQFSAKILEQVDIKILFENQKTQRSKKKQTTSSYSISEKPKRRNQHKTKRILQLWRITHLILKSRKKSCFLYKMSINRSQFMLATQTSN